MTPEASPGNVVANEYLAPRSAEDLDLVKVVRDILTESGLAIEAADHYDNHPLIQEASQKRPEPQRFILNKFWYFQLLSIPVNSMEERFCLVPNGEISDWIKLFKEKIIPFAVQHRLPRGL